MTPRPKRLTIARWPTMAASLVAAVACGSGPTSVTLPPLEVLVASGDSQYGTAGQTLQKPLQVHVRAVTTEIAQNGVNVVWTVEAGDASVLGVATTPTDSAGAAKVTVRLGSTVGEVRLRAAIQDQQRASALFRLFIVNPPTLGTVEPAGAEPGASIVLTGTSFSPDPAQNVVLFSGVRGVVTAASSTQLVVTVPTCLPAREVAVTVQLGTVASGSVPFTVGAGGDVLSMATGDVFDATGDGGFTCVTVPSSGTERYLVAVHSASGVGAASHPFELTGLAAAPSPLLAGHRASALQPRLRQALPSRESAGELWTRFTSGSPHALDHGLEPQGLWDRHLREMESELTRRPHPVPASPDADPHLSIAPVPTLGERRTFQVFRSTGDFVEVTAVARRIGARAALFVDEDAPAGGYDDADLLYFSDLFDDLIYPSVAGTFGSASDLDGNARIVILFTPAVNKLTPKGSDGFVGGFFFGVDLLPESQGSNAGEIFYALVPDETGEHSDPRPKDALLELTPAILAHEFQHMVHFNERVLVRGAGANEAVWLSEGLAQYAEELVARAAATAGASPGDVDIFRDGTRARARRYLTRPDTVSLIVSVGSGNLPERGAGFLHVMYLADRFGGDVVGDLTHTTRTGVTNVEAETGTDWPSLLSDWWSAIHLDGPGPESGPLVYPTVDLRGFLEDPYPLEPIDLGGGDFTRSGSLRSSAVAYYIVDPSNGGSVTLRLGGEAGGPSIPQARMRMRVIRVQ